MRGAPRRVATKLLCELHGDHVRQVRRGTACGQRTHHVSVRALLERLRSELPKELATLEVTLEATRRHIEKTEGLAAEVEASIAEAEQAADMVVAVVSQWRRETQEELDQRRRAAREAVTAERAQQEGLVEKLELACDVVRGVMSAAGEADVEGMDAAVQAIVRVGEARVGDGARQGACNERAGLKSIVVVGVVERAVKSLLDGAKVRQAGFGRRLGGGAVMVRLCGMGRVFGGGRIGSEGPGHLHGQFSFPIDVAVLENGKLVVCDSVNNRLQIVTVEGSFMRTIGSRGSGNLQFDYPRGVAVLADGNLVVCDSDNHRLQIVTAEGSFVRTIGIEGSGNLQFKMAQSVAVLENGNLVVCDSENHRLQIVTAGGNFVRTLGGPDRGRGNHAFCFPYDVAVLENGNLIVCDSNNRRLQIFTAEGEFVRTIPCAKPLSVAVLDRDHVAVGIGKPHYCIDIVRVTG